jgi:hypothetical protein
MSTALLFLEIRERVVPSIVILVVDQVVCVGRNYLARVLPPYEMMLVHVPAAVLEARVFRRRFH